HFNASLIAATPAEFQSSFSHSCSLTETRSCSRKRSSCHEIKQSEHENITIQNPKKLKLVKTLLENAALYDKSRKITRLASGRFVVPVLDRRQAETTLKEMGEEIVLEQTSDVDLAQVSYSLRDSVERRLRAWTEQYGLELLRLHRVEVLGDILVLNRQSFQGEEWGSVWSVIASARSVVRESSNHATRDISNTITHDVSNTITKDISNNITHDMSNNITHDMSNNITHDMSNSITEEKSHGITHSSNNITKDTPATPSTPLPPPLNERESSLLRLLADCYHCQRVGVHEEIDCGPKRQSHSRIVFSQREKEDGWVTVKQNGVFYSWPFERVMFASGNNTERRRMGDVRAVNQVVVDLYAGIGYFTIPIAAKAGAKHVYCFEINDDSVKALRRNIDANGVSGICEV
ncbi:hypothetical protein WA538_005890, partial [Blastocystis sp. DL]